MAQVMTPGVVAGQKRGPGRPPKDATAKKAKIATPTGATRLSPAQSPGADASATEKTSSKLPIRITDSKPLPTLPEPQTPGLSDEEYHSIAASAVLAASLDRSRQRWLIDGIFERVAVKSSKNVNGIDLRKDYEDFGQCRIRVEPHMFEVNVWVQKQPVYRPPPRPPITNWNSGTSHGQYNKPYTAPSQTQYRTPVQPRPMSTNSPAPAQVSAVSTPGGTPVGTSNSQQHPASKAPPLPQVSNDADGKPSPDPVISMLATRASSDPVLKALMKEVATGKATPEQLKIFQHHIDELTQVVEQKKGTEESQAKKQHVQTQASQTKQTQGTAASPLNSPAPTSVMQPPRPPVPVQQTPSTPYSHPQAYQWHAPPPQPPPPITREVLFQFKSPGANDDKFRFPQNSILEYLSAQHCLASFIITRKGRDGVDQRGLSPNTEYWQPVTLLIECAYGRDHILAHVNKYVKPADEVRKHMEEIMKRCTRAPISHLALRLPIKGTAAAESEVETAEGTPAVEDSAKAKYSTKPVMKVAAPVAKKKQPTGDGDSKVTDPVTQEVPKSTDVSGTEHLASPKLPAESVSTSADSKSEAPPTTDNGRPKRAVRKSVRISEG